MKTIEIKNLLQHIGKRQTRNLVNLTLGRPLRMSNFKSMTLDWDDVKIANEWLSNRSSWKDETVVSHYEAEFSQWNGSKYAFAFMAARVALSACIYALDLQPEDEVILPGYTCVVVPNAFKWAGVKTVYCDIELDTYGLDINQIESKITSKTRAILLHHLYGIVCRDYEAILDLAKRYKLKVIEDCAHTTGAEYRGRKVGNFGDVAIYSSERSKVFNTIQGGVAVTNDNVLGKRLKEYYEQAPYPDELFIDNQLSNILLEFYQFKHPQSWCIGDIYYCFNSHKKLFSTTEQEEKGIRPAYYGQKMPAPIAALGLNQLKKIDYYSKCRRNNSQTWEKWCQENGYKKPLVIDASVPVYLFYPVIVESEIKKEVKWWGFKNFNVSVGDWFNTHIYPVPGRIPGCKNADIAVEQCINFPTLNHMCKFPGF
ncbi:MAG: aminotransferase class I/II-fold pyridoxal phosphate-dependent enzyme [Richelia sp.]|nr:aminotransferase class I/II-fold pyridoxal phosphate-dependent enzyme [Richelia sp.]CDN14279.1 UDP-4-amino-4-deoxy-L-arabinose--oxoglutarate aminotransferase [Richelia intracellularis]